MQEKWLLTGLLACLLLATGGGKATGQWDGCWWKYDEDAGQLTCISARTPESTPYDTNAYAWTWVRDLHPDHPHEDCGIRVYSKSTFTTLSTYREETIYQYQTDGTPAGSECPNGAVFLMSEAELDRLKAEGAKREGAAYDLLKRVEELVRGTGEMR